MTDSDDIAPPPPPPPRPPSRAPIPDHARPFREEQRARWKKRQEHDH